MAFRLEREKTTSTPYVLIDEEKNYMQLKGRCFHEKMGEFFEDISKWLDEYLVSDFGLLTFDCEINYMNSSTIKLLYNILVKMDGHVSGQNKIIVNWITVKDNEIMVECGEDFREDIENIEFNMVIT